MDLPKETMMLDVEVTGVDFIPGPGHEHLLPSRKAHLMDKRPTTFDEVPPHDFIPDPNLPSNVDGIPCPVCGKMFQNRAGLSSHIRSHRNESH